MKTHKESQLLCHFRLRMPKNESSFLYFILEGHDNLCFYSTLPHEEGDSHRTLELFSSIEFQSDLQRLWAYLKTDLQLEVIEESTVLDK